MGLVCDIFVVHYKDCNGNSDRTVASLQLRDGLEIILGVWRFSKLNFHPKYFTF